MKVIFLDIDGVLNTSETFKIREQIEKETGIWNIEIDEFRVEYLKQIIDDTGAKVVLSSGWKKDFENIDGKIIPIHEKGIGLLNILNKHCIELYDIFEKWYDELLEMEKIHKYKFDTMYFLSCALIVGYELNHYMKYDF